MGVIQLVIEKQDSLNTRHVLLNEIGLLHFVCSLSGNFVEKKWETGREEGKKRDRERQHERDDSYFKVSLF